MAAYIQTKKKLIDVGEVGNANTGDIIYDGGVKVNDNLDALYNTFGDARLYESGKGVGSQILHATGYYQKQSTQDYAAGPIENGTMHDIDTTAGTFVITLPTPKRGEMVEFINSNGSFAINEIIIAAQAGATISGKNQVSFSLANSHITFICIADTPGSAIWEYKISPMYGDFSVPVDETIAIASTSGETSISLFRKDMYDGAKLIMAAKETGVGVLDMTVSEVLLLIDSTSDTVLSDEYSVLFKNERIFTAKFEISAGQVIAKITATKPNINFSLKSIETIKTR